MSDPKLRLVGDAVDDTMIELSRWQNGVDWIERDRQIAELRAKQEAESTRAAATEHRDAVIAAGFKLREIEEAERADESKPAIVAVKNWDPTQTNIIVLSGAAGVGKTVAAAYWALHRKRAPRFLTSAMFARSSRYDEEQRRQWLSASALVLDDLGAEYADAKGSFRTDLDELINEFYGNRRPLLITTNMLPPAFKSAYGERITDRLREAGRWISLDGDSLRRKR